VLERPGGAGAALARIAALEAWAGRGGAGGVLGVGPRPAVAVPGTPAEPFADALARVSSPAARAFPLAAAPVTTPVDSASSGQIDTNPFVDLFRSAEARHGVPARLLAAVASVESGFRTDAVSPAGAQGLMQFMPSTAAGMGVDPWDPASAIDGAARLLRSHLQRFGSVEAALAAYNVGPGTVARSGGVPASAQGYVQRVLSRAGALTGEFAPRAAGAGAAPLPATAEPAVPTPDPTIPGGDA
jgi:soluble lytic murein transglycosylase-like protein